MKILTDSNGKPFTNNNQILTVDGGTHKEWNFTITQAVTSGKYSITSGDSDIAAHYNDTKAQAQLFYNEDESSAVSNSIFYNMAENVLVSKNTYSISISRTSSSYSTDLLSIKLANSGTNVNDLIQANSNGDLYIVLNTQQLSPGSYRVTFTW